MRASELHKRPKLRERAQIDGMEGSTAPGSGRFLVAPELMGVDEWEALAATYQDSLTRDALADINRSVAAGIAV